MPLTDFQTHHIVLNSYRTDPIFGELKARGLFDIDGPLNMMRLPNASDAVAAALPDSGDHSLPQHLGRHVDSYSQNQRSNRGRLAVGVGR